MSQKKINEKILELQASLLLHKKRALANANEDAVLDAICPLPDIDESFVDDEELQLCELNNSYEF